MSLSFEFLICKPKTLLNDCKDGKRAQNKSLRVSRSYFLHWAMHSCLYVQVIHILRGFPGPVALGTFDSIAPLSLSFNEKLIVWTSFWFSMLLNSGISVLKHKLPSRLQRQLRFSIRTWAKCVLACKQHVCSLVRCSAQVAQAWPAFNVLYLRIFLTFLRKAQYCLWLSVAQP